MILLIKTTHSVENKEKYVILMLFGNQCDLYIHRVHQYSTFHKSKEKKVYNGEALEKNSQLPLRSLKNKTIKYKRVKYIIGANSISANSTESSTTSIPSET